MKLIKTVLLSFTVIGFVALTSCKNSSSKLSEEKLEAKYIESCVSSAKKTYEKAGQKPNDELIEKICKCSGEKIKTKYGFDKIPTNSKEATSFLIETTKNCAKEAMAQ